MSRPEWYEIAEARKALEAASERMNSLQEEREEAFQNARRFRETLETIANAASFRTVPDLVNTARKALNLPELKGTPGSMPEWFNQAMNEGDGIYRP